MIAGIGIDIVEIQRIEAAIKRYGEHFLRRIFTDAERQYCDRFGAHRASHYAARFAAKEALSKAIGTGMRAPCRWKDISVVNGQSGKPELRLSGQLQRQYAHYAFHLSLSHSATHAVAVVVALLPTAPPDTTTA